MNRRVATACQTDVRSRGAPNDHSQRRRVLVDTPEHEPGHRRCAEAHLPRGVQLGRLVMEDEHHTVRLSDEEVARAIRSGMDATAIAHESASRLARPDERKGWDVGSIPRRPWCSSSTRRRWTRRAMTRISRTSIARLAASTSQLTRVREWPSRSVTCQRRPKGLLRRRGTPPTPRAGGGSSRSGDSCGASPALGLTRCLASARGIKRAVAMRGGGLVTVRLGEPGRNHGRGHARAGLPVTPSMIVAFAVSSATTMASLLRTATLTYRCSIRS